MSDLPDDTMTATMPRRYKRRLSDRILIAFHQACDQADFEVAEGLLEVLENMITGRRLPPAGRETEARSRKSGRGTWAPLATSKC
jgi:hypothetical protein